MNIQIPHDALIVMIGAAGCGKSTIAKHLFGESNVVSSDYCRYMVCGDETRQDVNSQAFQLFHKWIELRCSIGVLTVADATNVTHAARNTLCGIAKRWNRPSVALLIDTPLELIHLQNTSRQRIVPAHVVEKHYKQFQQTMSDVGNEIFDCHYVIDPFNLPTFEVG